MVVVSQPRERPPRNLNEQLALREAEKGAGRVIMRELNDPDLQAVSEGRWDKKAHIRHFGDGSFVEIHASVHVQAGLVWDIKIKTPP